MHYDFRTEAFDPLMPDGSPSWHDTSMKMLNVLMRDSVIPVHRHKDTNEIVIVVRGAGEEVEYETREGDLREVHRVRLEDGTTIFEAKDGAYDPEKTEEMYKF